MWIYKLLNRQIRGISVATNGFHIKKFLLPARIICLDTELNKRIGSIKNKTFKILFHISKFLPRQFQQVIHHFLIEIVDNLDPVHPDQFVVTKGNKKDIKQNFKQNFKQNILKHFYV